MAEAQFAGDAGDYEEDAEDETAAIAAMMGFAAFGSQGASKKRKYNPNTDATIDGQALEEVDRGGKRGKGSGGNQIPLGKVRAFRAFGTAALANAELENGGIGNPDEIVLDDDDDEEQEGDEDLLEGYEDEDDNVSRRGGEGRGQGRGDRGRGRGRKRGRFHAQEPEHRPQTTSIQPPPQAISPSHPQSPPYIQNAPLGIPNAFSPAAQAELDRCTFSPAVQTELDRYRPQTTSEEPFAQTSSSPYDNNPPGIPRVRLPLGLPPAVQAELDQVNRQADSIPVTTTYIPASVMIEPNSFVRHNQSHIPNQGPPSTQNGTRHNYQLYTPPPQNANNPNPYTNHPSNNGNHYIPRLYTGDYECIANPWANLEKKMGLEPRGKWPEDGRRGN